MAPEDPPGLDGLRPQLDPDPIDDPSGFLNRELDRHEAVHKADSPRLLTVDQCALDPALNPKRHRLTEAERLRLGSLLDRNNPRIREIRSTMAVRENAAFREAIGRGEYTAQQHRDGAGGFRVTELLEQVQSRLGLTYEDLHYWYVSCGGKASFCIYFTRRDDPEFFRLLDSGRPLLQEQMSEVREFFRELQ